MNLVCSCLVDNGFSFLFSPTKLLKLVLWWKHVHTCIKLTENNEFSIVLLIIIAMRHFKRIQHLSSTKQQPKENEYKKNWNKISLSPVVNKTCRMHCQLTALPRSWQSSSADSTFCLERCRDAMPQSICTKLNRKENIFFVVK